MTIQVLCVFATSRRLPTHVVFVPTSHVCSSVIPRLFQTVTIKKQAAGRKLEVLPALGLSFSFFIFIYYLFSFLIFNAFSRIICLCNPSFQHLARLQTGSSLLPLSVLFWRAFIFRPIINNTTPDVCSSRLKTAPISHPKIH